MGTGDPLDWIPFFYLARTTLENCEESLDFGKHLCNIPGLIQVKKQRSCHSYQGSGLDIKLLYSQMHVA